MSTKAIATLSLMTLFVVAPAFAERPLKAVVPFDFTVGAKHMSAGEYTVTFDIPGVVRIAREDRRASCAVITTAVHAGKILDAGRLVFHRYGESYFLSQIWSPGYDQGRELRKSKTELEVARRAAGVRLASVRVTPQ